MSTAWGRGLATIGPDGTVLDTWFRHLGLGHAPNPGVADDLAGAVRRDDVRGVDIRTVDLSIDTDEAPASASDVYLRLHLLSHRLVQPRTINLDGAFGLLANVAWTNLGPVPVDAVDSVRLKVRTAGGLLTVHGVDRFPRMTDYVVSSV